MPVVFGRTVSGFIIRGLGTHNEHKFAVDFGGDLIRNALFQTRDRPLKGDELESYLWEENRVVTRVDAHTNLDGGVAYWEARIVPKSEVQRAAGSPIGITISGTGNRINIGSVDHSIQTFNTSSFDSSAVLSALNEIADALKKAQCSESERQDALVDIAQAKLELERPTPEPGRIWKALDRANSVVGLGEKMARLGVLLGQAIP